MATRAKTEEAVTVPTTETIDPSEPINPALEMLYAELGITGAEDATIIVNKMDGAERDRVWRGPPDEYDIDTIAKTYGSGKYEVKVMVRTLTGQVVPMAGGSRIVGIRLTPEDEAKLRARIAATSGQTATPMQHAPSLTAEDISRMISLAVQAAIPKAPEVNPIEMMGQLAGVLKSLMPPTIAQTQVIPQSDPMAMMTNMIGLIKLMKGDADDAPSATGANSNDVLLGLVTKFGPLLGGLLSGGGAPGMGAMPQQMMQPVQPMLPGAPQTNPIQPQETPQEGEDVNMGLKMGLNFLVAQAGRNGDPSLYAEMIADNVSAVELQKIVTSPNAIDHFVALVPAVGQYRPWFQAVIEELKAIVAEAATQVKTDIPEAKP